MKAFLVFASMVGCIVPSGCASHYYRIEGPELTLILRHPQASSVILATSLDRFKSRPAINNAGRWEVTLPADKPFRYFYWVDGELFLPDCAMKENDDFGSQTCLFDPCP